MTPLCSRSCLQLALAAAVYILLGLPPCSTQECRLELTERLKKRSVTFRNIDIKLCQFICQDDFIFASCRQLKMIEKRGGSSVRPQNHPLVKTKSCTSKVCNPRTSGRLQTEPRKAVAVQGVYEPLSAVMIPGVTNTRRGKSIRHLEKKHGTYCSSQRTMDVQQERTKTRTNPANKLNFLILGRGPETSHSSTASSPPTSFHVATSSPPETTSSTSPRHVSFTTGLSDRASDVIVPHRSLKSHVSRRKYRHCDCHAVGSTLESRCKRDSDCPAARKFVCFTKTCKCEPGTSFNPANNSCVRRCITYGDGFTRYPGLGIKASNERRVKSKTVERCSKRCIRQETFLCLTYDYHLVRKGANCFLSKVGYLDVSSPMRLVGQDGWMLIVRNCA